MYIDVSECGYLYNFFYLFYLKNKSLPPRITWGFRDFVSEKPENL